MSYIRKKNKRPIAYISIIWGIGHIIFYIIGLIAFLSFLFMPYKMTDTKAGFLMYVYVILNAYIHLQSCYYLWKGFKARIKGLVKFNLFFTLIVGIYLLISVLLELLNVDFPYWLLGLEIMFLLIGAVTLAMNGFTLLEFIENPKGLGPPPSL